MPKIEKLEFEITFSPSSKDDGDTMILRTSVNRCPYLETWSNPITLISEIAELMSHMSLRVEDILYQTTPT